MKKIVYLFVLLFLFIPTIVLADSSSPSILGYDAVVTNKKGVKVETGDGNYTVAYNTKVHVYAEYDTDASCELINPKDSDPDYTLSIPLKDLSPIKKEVFPKDLQKVNNQGSTLKKDKDEFIVVNTKGTKLSKGPADIYGKYDKVIPYETKLHTTHYINTERSTSWYYVDDGEYKGWLDIYNGDCGILHKGDILTFNKGELKGIDGNVLITIPAEEKFSESFMSNDGFYLKYKDQSGFIKRSDSFDIGYKSSEGYILTLSKTNIISIDGVVRGTIPVGEKIKVIYCGTSEDIGDVQYHSAVPVVINDKAYYYIEYSGIKGFVLSDDVDSLYFEYEIKTVDLKEEKDFYPLDLFTGEKEDEESFDDYLKRHKRIERIPKSATITYYDIRDMYDSKKDRSVYLELIKYKGKLGCIITYYEDDEDEETTPSPSPTSSIKPIAKPKNDKPNVRNKDNNMILYCIIGGVLLTISAIGTIIAINKKKKKNNKKEEIKQETKIEPKELKENSELDSKKDIKKEEVKEENN